jgi:hypothetical protein
MRLNKGIPTLPTLKKYQIPFRSGFVIPFHLGLCFRNQASGFRGPTRLRGSVTGIWHPASGIIVPIIANFTVLLFYFFEKKKIKNIRTFRSTFLKSLKYKNKIDFFCSKIVQHARTYVNQHFFTFSILKT